MAAKVFETLFKIGGKYLAGPAFGALNRDLNKTERHAKQTATGLKTIHSHVGKIAAAVGITAGAYKALAMAMDLWREGVEASKEAVDVAEKLEMTAGRMSKKWGESSQKIIDSVNKVSKKISDVGVDFEDVQAGVTILSRSMGNTKNLENFGQAFADITATTKGAVPGMEGFKDSANAIRLAIQTGKSPLLKQLDWTDKQMKAFKKLSPEQRRITLQEFARIRLAGAAKRASETTAGALGKEAVARENVAQALAGGSVDKQKKIALSMEKFWKAMEPAATVVGEKLAAAFERWANVIDKNGPTIAKVIGWITDKVIAMIDGVMDMENLEMVITGLKEKWDTFWTYMKSIAATTLEAITGTWSELGEVFSAGWEKIKEIWNAIPAWFDENVVKKISALWDWLIGNSYMVEGAQRGWDEIKKIWGEISDWFYDHVIKPISEWWDWLWKKGVPMGAFAGGGGAFRGAGATGSWGGGAGGGRGGGAGGGGEGATGAGGGEIGSTEPNEAIAAERARVMEQLKEPGMRELVAATLAQEQGSAGGRADVLESLVNRAVVTGKHPRDLITGGGRKGSFYGPWRRGEVQRAMARGMSPKALEEFDAMSAAVGAGRNRIRGRTDQGMANEVHGAIVKSAGEYYGEMGYKGEKSTAAWRAGSGLAPGPTKAGAQATKMIKEGGVMYQGKDIEKATPQNYTPLQPAGGTSLRGMLKPMNMQQRGAGAAPQNVTMSPMINVHGVPADRAGAVGDEVIKAMQDPSRRLIAQLKKTRSDELRLNMDATT